MWELETGEVLPYGVHEKVERGGEYGEGPLAGGDTRLLIDMWRPWRRRGQPLEERVYAGKRGEVGLGNLGNLGKASTPQFFPPKLPFDIDDGVGAGI